MTLRNVVVDLSQASTAPGTENFVSLSAPPGCYPALPATPDSQGQTLAQDN